MKATLAQIVEITLRSQSHSGLRAKSQAPSEKSLRRWLKRNGSPSARLAALATTRPAVTPVPADAASPSPVATPSTEWLYHWRVTEGKSPIDDSLSLALGLTGKSDRESQSQLCIMVLRYKERKWDVIVSPAAGYLGSTENPKVTLRWDREKAETGTWLASSDGRSAFAPSARKFINRAIGASTLVMRFYPRFSGEETATFDMTGLSAELAKYPEAQKALGK
jgi:hypothetical protein